VTKSTPNRQREFQDRVISASGVDPRIFVSLSIHWWRNPTNHNSLRLTWPGFKFFSKQINLPSYDIELVNDLRFKHLLQLERLFQAPYYIGSKSLHVFSEQDAVMLQLHAGNLAQYLDNLESNKDQ